MLNYRNDFQAYMCTLVNIQRVKKMWDNNSWVQFPWSLSFTHAFHTFRTLLCNVFSITSGAHYWQIYILAANLPVILLFDFCIIKSFLLAKTCFIIEVMGSHLCQTSVQLEIKFTFYINKTNLTYLLFYMPSVSKYFVKFADISAATNKWLC